MKRIVLVAWVLIFGMNNAFTQNDSVLKFIFIPHPRSDDNVNQSVNPGIVNIDFSRFDMIMLGGDLTFNTSKNRATLEYCDSIFHLDSPNTLWTFGNHDVQSGNRALIKEFTGRQSFYSYYRNNLTFLVLDTELNASSSSTYITGPQLELVKNVCDTISKSKYLILLHHRLMWMINNNYFASKLDSVAGSTNSLDTTNFYSDLYPLLKKVKEKGVQVLVLGGDRSNINLKYSPEDSITFFATRLFGEYSDSINNLLILNYNQVSQNITTIYISLAEIDKDTTNNQDTTSVSGIIEEQGLFIWPSLGSNEIRIKLQSPTDKMVSIQIFSINGTLFQSVKLRTNQTISVSLNHTGLYIVKAFCGDSVFVKKFFLP